MESTGKHSAWKFTNEILRFIRFSMVGLLGTVLDVAILTILHALCSFPLLLANGISYSCGIINNYLLNRFWTYRENGTKEYLAQFTKFAVCSLIGLVLNSLLVVFLEPVVAGAGLDAAFMYAKILATGVVLLWNFFANRLWTFAS